MGGVAKIQEPGDHRTLHSGEFTCSWARTVAAMAMTAVIDVNFILLPGRAK